MFEKIAYIVKNELSKGIRDNEIFHSVKGKEYTTVIKFRILNGYVPHWNTIINRSQDYRESETKKLLYVVCSRVKNIISFFRARTCYIERDATYANGGNSIN